MVHGPDRFRDEIAQAYDVIVVGAGMGGMVTAALLGQAGRSVLLLDGHYVAGGNATVFRRKQFEFDVGVHYLGDCGPNGVIPRILRACGAREITFRPMQGELEQLSFPDLEFTIPRGKREFRKRLVARFPSEAKGIDRYLSFLDQVDRAQHASLVSSKLGQLATMARLPLVLRYAGKSFGEFLDSCTKDPKLRAVLTAQNGTYAISPERVSAILHAGLQNHYFIDGGWYPEGGGQVMADRLAEAIEGAGGQIRLRSRVSRIEVEGGRVRGVTIDSKHLGKRMVCAPVVVSNADLKRTVLELVGAKFFPERFVERVHAFEMALPLFVVYMGLDIPVSELPYGNANRWIFGSYDFDGEYSCIKAGDMPEHPFVYLATASAKDPHNRRLAPEGHTNLQAMTIVPAKPEFWGVNEEEMRDGSYRANEHYCQRKNEITESVLREAERAIPDLRRHIVFQEAATPMTHTRYTESTGGTSYGIAATPGQFLSGRPGSSTPIAGLYLAGASTRSGHGIGGSMISGAFAAGSVLGDNLVGRILGDS